MRRSRLDMYLDVLRAVKKGRGYTTYMMREANVDWLPLQEILNKLLDYDYITEVNVDGEDKRLSTRYEITNKGLNTLRYLKDYKDLIDLPPIY